GVLVRTLARSGADETALDTLAEQAWMLSEGNPFMIVEAVRASREGAEVRAAPGLPMPERVRRLVASRLDRLGQREQRLLAGAARIGREVEIAFVQRGAGLRPQP